MRRRWSINGRFLTQPVTGVQRYAVEIVEALDRLISEGHPLARDLEVDLVTPPGTTAFPALKAIAATRCGTGGGHPWEQLMLPLAAPGGLLSLCNTGPLFARRHIVCVHDVNTRLAPDSYSRAFRAVYGTLIPALGRTATTIATVSQRSADDLARLRIAAAQKIVVIGNGHEHALRWRAAHSERTRAVAGPSTVVVIGTPSPHKNVGVLVRAAGQLAAAGLKLALIGSTNLRVFGAMDTLADAPNLHVLGRLDESEIAALLEDSLCLAFPSLVEGFGLPPIEAMARGCPTVVSTASCLPEICGDASLYASPTAPDEWLQAFVRLRDDGALRRRQIERGHERIARYRWSRSAELYLEAMARADGVAVPAAELSGMAAA